MIRTVTVVPAVLAENKLEYRKQIERINNFARRVHIDISDGAFAPATTVAAKDIKLTVTIAGGSTFNITYNTTTDANKAKLGIIADMLNGAYEANNKTYIEDKTLITTDNLDDFLKKVSFVIEKIGICSSSLKSNLVFGLPKSPKA